MVIDLKTLDEEVKDYQEDEDVQSVTEEDIAKSEEAVNFVYLYSDLQRKTIHDSIRMFNRLSRYIKGTPSKSEEGRYDNVDNTDEILDESYYGALANVKKDYYDEVREKQKLKVGPTPENKFLAFWFKIWTAIRNLFNNIKNWIINALSELIIKFELNKQKLQIRKNLKKAGKKLVYLDPDDGVTSSESDNNRFDKSITELNFSEKGLAYSFKKMNPSNYLSSLDKLEEIARNVSMTARMCKDAVSERRIAKSSNPINIEFDKLIVKVVKNINSFSPPHFWDGSPLLPSDCTRSNTRGEKLVVDKMKDLNFSFDIHEKEYLNYFFKIDLIKSENVNFESCMGTTDNNKMIAMTDVLIKTMEVSKIKLFKVERYIYDADYILKSISKSQNPDIVGFIDVLLAEFKTLTNIQRTMALLSSTVFRKFCNLTTKYHLYNGTSNVDVA